MNLLLMPSCVSSFGFAAGAHLEELQILQNRALKIVHKLPLLTHTTDLYSSTKILIVRSLYYQQLSILIQNVLIGRIFNNFNFSYCSNILPTRSNDLLEIKRARTTRDQNKNICHNGSKFFILFIRFTDNHLKFKSQFMASTR
jgi:hypothetical protein